MSFIKFIYPIFPALIILLFFVLKKKSFLSTTNEQVTIGFAGDTMLGRSVNEKIGQSSYSYVWGNLLPLLRKNDLNIINLETTLTKSDRKVPKVFNFKADPDRVQTLVQGKIDVVCIANNHIGDFDKEGLLETIKVLDQAGILYVGAGKNASRAHLPIIIEKNRIKIGVLGFTDNEAEWEAKENIAGTNYLSIGDIKYEQRFIDDVKKIRSNVDILIVSAHWGPNKREHPTREFIKFAHSLVDAGVDIFHGHSAHIFQGIEIYKNKLIMYDTGDFVDDYMVYPDLRNDISFLFLVTVDRKKIKNIQLIPTLISNIQVNLALNKDFDWAVDRIKKLSSPFGTKIIQKDSEVMVEV